MLGVLGSRRGMVRGLRLGGVVRGLMIRRLRMGLMVRGSGLGWAVGSLMMRGVLTPWGTRLGVLVVSVSAAKKPSKEITPFVSVVRLASFLFFLGI